MEVARRNAMAMDAPALEREKTAGQKPGIVDCDVHPTIATGLNALFPYMPDAWRRRFERKGAGALPVGLTLRFAHPNGAVVREDARNEAGAVGGSDPAFLARDLIDAHGIETVVLNSLQTGALCATFASIDESIVIASAANDYFIEEWLPHDARFTYAAVVPSQDPAAGAREIRRIGANPQVSAIALPPIATLLGNRYFHPIYEAAQEFDLPIFLHVTGTDSIYHSAPMSAGGLPDTYVERYVTLSQAAEANLNSLIFNGTFEKFPRLKVLFVEYGFVWPIATMLRMDRLWRGLRHEVPWVRKSPIDYVADHVWFATQPIEEPRNPEDLERLVQMVGVGNLCFSTDYPHWDNDMPMQSLRALKAEDRDRIMRTNARDVLRLSQ
jgi:predicted TIM-barrel fold metal-dependent hydrolase